MRNGLAFKLKAIWTLLQSLQRGQSATTHGDRKGVGRTSSASTWTYAMEGSVGFRKWKDPGQTFPCSNYRRKFLRKSGEL